MLSTIDRGKPEMTGTDRGQRGARWRVRMGAVALATVGGAVLIGMSGTANAAPDTTTCDGVGLSGDKLVGSDRGAAASSPAGSGTTSEDKRAWEVTVHKGWTGTGVVIKRGQSIEIHKGEYVGPTSVRSDQGSTVLNTTILPPVTSWYLCGERTPADGTAAAQPKPSRKVWMVGTPPSWPKDAPFGPTTGQAPQAPQEPQAPQNPQAPAAAPDGKAPQAPGAPAAAPDEWLHRAGGPVDARPAGDQPAAGERVAHDDGSQLPTTGIPAGLLAIAGVMFVAAGVGLLYSARRRES